MSTATLEKRVESLEHRMTRQESLAGPGQNAAFSQNFIEIRKQLDKFGKVQEQHTRKLDTLTTDVATLKSDVATLKSDMVEVKGDVATLKSDVATLKGDMVEVKGTLREILDRLPAQPKR